MEHADWTNKQVRQQIEALQQTHGFEEDEALAYWHIREAAKLMNEMRIEDLIMAPEEYTAPWYSTVHQHFIALYRALGERVLQRDYPDGWS
jgi:hypothetical protein